MAGGISPEGSNSSIGGQIGMSSTKRKGTTTTKLFDIADLESLRALLGDQLDSLAPNLMQFSKQNAMMDSAGLIEGLSRQLQEKLLPQIGAAETMGGAYNSTSKMQLGNDLISRVAEQAAGLQLQTVKDYAQMQNLQFQPLLELFGILKGADATETTKSKEKTKGGGLSFGLGF